MFHEFLVSFIRKKMFYVSIYFNFREAFKQNLTQIVRKSLVMMDVLTLYYVLAQE